MKPEDFLKHGKAHVLKETFAVVKSKKPMQGAFAVIQDSKEITLVIEQSKIKKEQAIESERGWKIITFDMVLPFGLTGFLAAVSRALASEDISIFALSAYSTDHILVKKKNIEKAMKKLKQLGITFET